MTLEGNEDIGLPGRRRSRPLMEPTRVVVDRHALGVTPARAWDDYRVEPSVIYVRNDGWSLGAPAHLSNVAFATWAGQWVEKWVRQGAVWVMVWPPDGVTGPAPDIVD